MAVNSANYNILAKIFSNTFKFKDRIMYRKNVLAARVDGWMFELFIDAQTQKGI